MKVYSLIVSFVLHSIAPTLVSTKEWLSNANYYQIYPRSYMDSDGDGYGDLKGIQSKVTYLADLGMDGVWLSPIMKSPMKDHGYDISDYRQVNEEFGTMQDLENLIAACKRNGVQLILDFVPNHTSDEHDWFIKSENKEPGYEDYYIWHPGKPNPNAGGRPLPPNNWISVFRFSAWQWSEKRKEYYYHAFIPGQPDLNYRNPKVVDEMKDVLRFWLNKGIAGFRIDAVPFLFEIEPDENGDYPDEPESNEANCDGPDAYCYLRHIYTQDRPETFDMAYQWRDVINEFSDPPRVLLTEAYTALSNIMKFYTDGKGRNGSHVPFNFELLSNINAHTTAREMRTVIENYLNHIPNGYEPNWVLGNHDQHRITSRLGEDRPELYNILLQTLPGNAVTYYGEEIIMPNVYIPWGLTQDPGACATNETIFHQNSRDPARTPMQWDDSKNAGFSTGSSTWLPVGSNYRTVNVKAQEAASNSHLKVFKRLVQLHKSNLMQNGLFESARNVPDHILAFVRGWGNEANIVVLNFGSKQETLDLNKIFRGLAGSVRVEVASLSAKLNERQVLASSSVTLPASSGVVLSSTGSSVVTTVSPSGSTQSSQDPTGNPTSNPTGSPGTTRPPWTLPPISSTTTTTPKPLPNGANSLKTTLLVISIIVGSFL